MLYALNLPIFQYFLEFYQYLYSEFSKNTDKSVYLEALVAGVPHIIAKMC